MAIPDRVFIPRDVFITWCVQLQHLSDCLQIAIVKVIAQDDPQPALHDATVHLHNLMEFAKAVMGGPESEGGEPTHV